jgi:hypothetical protein
MGDMKLQIHPLSSVLPSMPEEELNELAAHIKENGLREPITLYAGKILDGRHRYAACEMAGVEPKFVEFEGDDPAGFVRGKNVIRRHLTADQRAMFAASLVSAKAGDNQFGGRDQTIPTSVFEAAEKEGVSLIKTKRARRILTKGSKRLVDAVVNKKANLADAATVASLPKREQTALVRRGPKAIQEKAETMRRARGGLAAEAMVGRESDADGTGAANKPVLRVLDKFWETEGIGLEVYPPARPKRVFELIRRLFA